MTSFESLSNRKLAYKMSILVTVLGGLYLLGLAGKLLVDGTVHSVSAPPVQVISAIVALLLNISLLILFTSIRFASEQSVYADLAVVFMILVCGTSCVNWFVQVSTLPLVVQSGDSGYAGLIDSHSTQSVFYAIERLGWGVFYGLALLFISTCFQQGKLGLWIKWLWIIGGGISLIHAVGVMFNQAVLADLGYIAWGILLPAVSALLIRYYLPGKSG